MYRRDKISELFLKPLLEHKPERYSVIAFFEMLWNVEEVSVENYVVTKSFKTHGSRKYKRREILTVRIDASQGPPAVVDFSGEGDDESTKLNHWHEWTRLLRDHLSGPRRGDKM